MPGKQETRGGPRKASPGKKIGAPKKRASAKKRILNIRIRPDLDDFIKNQAAYRSTTKTVIVESALDMLQDSQKK